MPIVYSKKKKIKIINLLFQRVAHWPDNYNTKKKKNYKESVLHCVTFM